MGMTHEDKLISKIDRIIAKKEKARMKKKFQGWCLECDGSGVVNEECDKCHGRGIIFWA